MSRVLVILDPAAGRGRALRSWPGLSRALLGVLPLGSGDDFAKMLAPQGAVERLARRVLIESDDPLLVEADGEIVFEEAYRLEIEVLPGALGVLG